MKKFSVKRLFILGFILVSIAGTLFHFLYGWTGQNALVGLFTPVSESTWEHMKLLFFPMLLFTIPTIWIINPDCPHLTANLLWGNLIGTAIIPVLFYTYSGILGYHLPPVDIAIFFIAVLAAFLIAYKLCKKTKNMSERQSSIYLGVSAILTLLFALAFIRFTYHVPEFGIFKEPPH